MRSTASSTTGGRYMMKRILKAIKQLLEAIIGFFRPFAFE